MTQRELDVQELNAKFRRLVYHLGSNNSSGFVYKDGNVQKLKDSDGPTERYKFETEFAYILNDIVVSPDYIVQKHMDRANALISNLITLIKDRGETVEEV